ncbi:metal ABC transporter permease [Pasteurellaceae bacterium HPA106]|uniref:metal ABC transporter permease n=1 Tax=Spirabiliibacterium pneumoniae TaxID=221400 RepID=UPI001AAC9779|nr:metal ABC transporter permease [Spirabiliibacterium pneumoniae]MBE2896284.1 metal ABC transporter permease [Spirabiliibacterium pneumoniae]
MFDAIVNWFYEPLSFPFMQQALVTALLVAFVCALLSCYLVLKGWSLMGDAISHAVLPGIVLAFVLGLPLALGAFVSGILCAVFTGYLKHNSRLKEDTVMGIVFSGMFAFGLILFVKVETDQHLLHILFGNLLGVPKAEFILILVISLFTSAVILSKRKDFLLYCFDPIQAKIVGLPVKLLHYALLTLLALTIIAAMQVVGVILVVALLIAPGITAFSLTKRFDYMLIIAICVSIFSTLIGTLLSYHLDAATGPTIVLVQSLLFVTALCIRALKSKTQQRTLSAQAKLS